MALGRSYYARAMSSIMFDFEMLLTSTYILCRHDCIYILQDTYIYIYINCTKIISQNDHNIDPMYSRT